MLKGLSFEIREITPCIKDPSRIRFVAQADTEFPRELILTLSFRFPPGLVVYDEGSGALTLKLWGRLTTIFPSGKIGVTYTLNINEAKEILERIKELLIKAEEDLKRYGVPSRSEIDARRKLTALRYINIFPKQAVSFAVKLHVWLSLLKYLMVK